VVAEHYTYASAAEEIARWRDAHGGSLEPLVQAIDDCCPFVTRRFALLAALASAVPEGPSSSLTWPAIPVTARSSCSPGGRTSARRTRPRRRPPG
jgi:hypothetical protein